MWQSLVMINRVTAEIMWQKSKKGYKRQRQNNELVSIVAG